MGNGNNNGFQGRFGSGTGVKSAGASKVVYGLNDLPVRRFKDDIQAPQLFGITTGAPGSSYYTADRRCGDNIPRLQLTEPLGPNGYLNARLRAEEVARKERRVNGASASVDVYSYDVARRTDDRNVLPNHMYVVITDPHTGERWVARGGPSERDRGAFIAKKLQGKLYVQGEVRPIEQSQDTKVIRDDNKEIRYETSAIVKGVSGKQLADRAGLYIENVNNQKIRYGATSNSNSVAHGVYKYLTGEDYSRNELWGSKTELPRPLSTSQKRCRDLRTVRQGGTCHKL